ncbi:hypothetical protein PRIPAC_91946 [Pristionchus pacificus]|uniref:Uncharacterized protein n=1 Tax=Pristionchus pacificus TaxID=54126 RepID=A0A2A6BP87_PRIPA|nr:hypothetical protein PRIPAC_91946 [Pristionchus pacificus]|eukprot:PDM67636.1 hypothetical protein PRIPAC_45680 [Pristionchus pacificus]
MGKELYKTLFLKFLHHCPLRDVLLYSGDAEIVACGDEMTTYRLGKALMVVREFFKTIDEEDLVATRRDCENDGGEEAYMMKRGFW